MSVGGLVLILVFLSSSSEGVWVALMYGIILLILGLFILFNKKEDKIERRRDR
jgi:uncharacterized membrane protein HdeD (DUF308 family)